MADFDLGMLLSIIAITMCILIGIAIIYIYVKVFNFERSYERTVTEIKSKIGQIIRDINNINRMEYEVDVDQQSRINQLSRQVLGDQLKTEASRIGV